MHQNPQTFYQRSLSALLMKVRPAPLASLLKRTLGVRRFVIDTPQGKFWVDPVSNLGKQLCQHGTYEDGMIKTVQRYLSPGATFVDLGANEGYFTVIGSICCGPEGRVIAIEPQNRLLKVINENLRLNAVTWASLVNAAVTDTPGEVTINLAPDTNSGSSGLHQVTKYRVPTQKIEARTLSEILDDKGLERVDLMKVDIEGFEYEALLGSPEVFRKRRVRVLALELHPAILTDRNKDVKAITSLLSASGYSMTHTNGNDVWLASE